MLNKKLLLILLIDLLLIYPSLSNPEELKETDDIDIKNKSHVVGEPSEEELQKRRIEKVATLPFSHPPPDKSKTR